MGRLFVLGVRDLFYEWVYYVIKFYIILLNFGVSGIEKLYIFLRVILYRWFKRFKYG